VFTPQDEIEIKNRLSDVVSDVKLILFANPASRIILVSGHQTDEASEQTEKLIRALAAFSDKLKLEVYEPKSNPELMEKYRVTEIPTLILEGDRDYGIRYLGTPGGYEFASLLEDIIGIGKRESGLTEDSKQLIQSLTEPLDLKVFVTPG
jgi:alkyl hydroperoxide reductase subunit AhpF